MILPFDSLICFTILSNDFVLIWPSIVVQYWTISFVCWFLILVTVLHVYDLWICPIRQWRFPWFVILPHSISEIITQVIFQSSTYSIVLWTIPFVRWYWPIYPVDHFPLHGFSWRVSDDLFFYPYSIRQYYLSSDTCCLHNFIGHSLAPADHINLTQSVKSLRACCSTVVWESRVFLSLMFAYFQLCRENLYHFELVT